MRDIESISLLVKTLHETKMEYKFDYHSNAIMALMKIGDDYPHLRESISKDVKSIVEDVSWELEKELAPGIMKRQDSLLRINVAAKLNQWAIPHRISEAIGALELDKNELNLARRKGVIL